MVEIERTIENQSGGLDIGFSMLRRGNNIFFLQSIIDQIDLIELTDMDHIYLEWTKHEI